MFTKDVLHVCGHITHETKDLDPSLDGAAEAAERYFADLASAPCNECRYDEELAYAAEVEKRYRFDQRKMRGSEKQVKWARCIRARRVEEFAADQDTTPEELVAYVKWAKMQTAPFWIRYRRLTPASFISFFRDKNC